MNTKDLHNVIYVTSALNTTTINANGTTNGNVIDRLGFEGLEFIIQSGTLTTGTFTPLIEHGDVANLSDAAAVDDVDLLGTESDAAFAATDDNKVKKIGYVGLKRYVRLSIVGADTAAGTVSAVAAKFAGNLADVG